MKKIWFAYVTSLSLGLAFPALAQSQSQSQDQSQSQTQGQGTQPQMVASKLVTMHGTIQDVNPSKRTVTLKDQDGNVKKLKFEKQGPDFSKLHKGDAVDAAYYASAVVSLKKPGEEPTGTEQQQYVLKSEKEPGGVVVNTTQTTATVEKINLKKRQVTLKGPEGRTVKMKVDESVQGLDRIKKGDQIFVKYTEALGVSVSKSQS
jgi:hypothetical protein